MTKQTKSISIEMNRSSISQRHGFALIISLAVMSIILLLVLALTSMIRVDIKQAETQIVKEKAKLNALFALKEAIANLQVHAGEDQRITATGDLWTNPGKGAQNYVGVWNHEGKFQSWLVSNPNQKDSESINLIKEGNPAYLDENGRYQCDNPEYALLLGSGSVVAKEGSSDVQGVAAKKKFFGEDQTDKYAWWVGDEGVKAKLNVVDPYTHDLDGQASRNTLEKALLSSQSMKGVGISVLDKFSELSPYSSETAQKLDKILSFPQLKYLGISEGNFMQNFHDLTTHSYGLLTDTKNGGLKKDLSLLFEQDDSSFNSSSNPFHTYLDNQNLMYGGAPGPKSSIPLIFKQEVNSGDGYIYGPSWDLLRDYYLLYKGIKNRDSDPMLGKNWVHSFFPGKAWFLKNSGVANAGEAWAKTLGVINWRNASGIQAPETNKQINLSHNYWNQQSPLQVVRPTKGSYYPYLARYTMFASTVSIPSGGGYDMDIVLQPFIVMHNPFNVSIEAPRMRILTKQDQLGIHVRRGGGGWNLGNVYKDGSGDNGGKPNFGNMYQDADSTNDTKKYLTQKDSVLSGFNTDSIAFENNTKELVFNIPETTYAPGELKLFAVAAVATFSSREADLAEFGGNYDPSNGVYLGINTDAAYYVDHDNDNTTDRVNLLQGIPSGQEIAMKFGMSDWFIIGTEVYNHELNEFDTAASYYHPSKDQDGDNVLKDD